MRPNSAFAEKGGGDSVMLVLRLPSDDIAVGSEMRFRKIAGLFQFIFRVQLHPPPSHTLVREGSRAKMSYGGGVDAVLEMLAAIRAHAGPGQWDYLTLYTACYRAVVHSRAEECSRLVQARDATLREFLSRGVRILRARAAHESDRGAGEPEGGGLECVQEGELRRWFEDDCVSLISDVFMSVDKSPLYRCTRAAAAEAWDAVVVHGALR
jgi:hypothetical protein